MKCKHCGHEWVSIFDTLATPENLAVLIASLIEDSKCESCPAYGYCMAMASEDGGTPNNECPDVILGWLKSEAPRKRRARRATTKKPVRKTISKTKRGKRNEQSD